MIIDNLKEFISKFTDTHSTNEDCKEENKNLEELCVDVDSKEEEPLLGDIEWEEETETGIDSLIEEPLGGIPALNPDVDITGVYSPCIPDDEIDEPTPCVYGPPSWYDDNRNKERDRQREELRKLRQMEIQDSLVDKPTKCVYGPIP